MAELILTQEEKDALTWFDVPDDTLGKLVKRYMASFNKFEKDATGIDRVVTSVGAFIMIGYAVESNADSVSITLEGFEKEGFPFGDWIVTAQKVNK